MAFPKIELNLQLLETVLVKMRSDFATNDRIVSMSVNVTLLARKMDVETVAFEQYSQG